MLNGVVELYEVFFGALLGAELTQKQGVIFRYLARLMLAIPGATIHTLMQLMEDGKPFKPHMDKLEGSARYFFQAEFFHPSFAATKKQILRRLWGVLSTPAFERMFGQKENKLDLFEALQGGKIILVSTAKDLLKDEGSALFGRFFIAMLAQAATERTTVPEDERTPTFVYVDEAQEYFDDRIESILTQARKQKVGFHAAHQALDQLSPRLRAAFNSNTSLKCVGGVSAKDARALADELHTTSDFIEGMKRHRDRTEFAVRLRNETPHAIRMLVPLGFLERQPTLDDDQFDELLAMNRLRYCGTAVEFSFAVPDTLNEPEQTPVAAQPMPTGPAPAETKSYRASVAPEREMDEPELAPAPEREAGKGGRQHRYLQALAKELGEAQGFKATVEAPLPGGGQVDVLLERDGRRIAIEISTTTPASWEAANIKKCVEAGCEAVGLVLTKPKVSWKRYEEAVVATISADQASRVSYLAPEDLPDFIDSNGNPGPEGEPVVVGYKIKVSRADANAGSAEARRQAISRIISKPTGFD